MRFLSPKSIQAGDTIVEVLIATAVAGLVLASSYAVANRNSITIQDIQEHNQALQYDQSQIELLRAYIAQGGQISNVINSCLSETGGSIRIYTSGSPSCPGANDPAKYDIYFNKSTTTGYYYVNATWNSLINGSKDNVTLYYGT